MLTPRYNHVRLTVGDLDRSIAFYARCFGMSVMRRDGPHEGERVETMTGIAGGALEVAFLSDGTFILELIRFTRQAGEREAGLPANEIGAPHLAFVTDDVRGIFARWQAEGVRFVSEPNYVRSRDAWSVMLTDSDGIMIELLEHSALSDEQLRTAREGRTTHEA